MKVFISWSGEKSFKVAEVLKEWIPCVIQGIDPYFSSADIDKGTRWSSDIAKELEAADFGILCVTKENLNSSWLNFEAGALSKAIDKAKVCPFLFDLKPSDISNSPILQFQMTNVDRDDIYKLFQSMNNCMVENSLSEERLKKMFDLGWPSIDAALKKVDDTQPSKAGKKQENNREIMEEMLDLLRSQQILLRNPEQLLPKEYLSIAFEDNLRRRVNEMIPQKLLDEQSLVETKLMNSLRHISDDEIGKDEINSLTNNIDSYITLTKQIFIQLGIKNVRRFPFASLSRKE